MVDENLVARIYTVDMEGVGHVGTGYPITPDLLLTAEHVVSYPEKDKAKGIFIVWPECKSQDDEELTSDAVIYKGAQQSPSADIALVRCKTPLNERLEVRSNHPPHKTDFICRGYPIAGLNDKQTKHDSLYFSGNTEGNAEGVHLQLTTKNEVVKKHQEKESKWSGLSGAPVFTGEHLTGVITFHYKTVEQCLFAVSIPYLLKHNAKFREWLKPTLKKDYKSEQKQELISHIESLSQSAIPCCETLIESFRRDHSACIADLSEKLSNQLSHLDDNDLQSLLSLLLTQLDVPGCDKSQDHTYNLKVGTQLLSEVAIASIYEVTPRFQSAEKGVAGIKGEFVIPPSLTEAGFDSARNAEEQSHAVAHAVYKKVYNKERKDIHSERSIKLYKSMNTHLANMRKQGKVYRFELDEEDANDAEYPLITDETRHHLKKELLPELLIAFYGEDFAFDEEPDLESQVGIYMEKLKTVKKS